MKAHRVFAIASKTFLTLRHDPRSLALMLVAPVMAMLVFGFAFGSDIQNVEIVVVNEDEGTLAADLIGRFNADVLRVTSAANEAEARAAVLDGRATAALIFPAEFTADASPRQGPSGPLPPAGASVRLHIDGSNTQLAGTVRQELMRAAGELAESRGGAQAVTLELDHVYAENARYIDTFVPGIMAFAALLFTTLLTLLAFVGERTTGTLDRLRSTPVTEGEIVMGYVVAFGAVAALQGILLLGAAVLLFDVLVVGSVFLAGAITILLAIDAMAIGVLVSSAAKREGQAVQFIPFIVLPTFLLSGIFVPIQSLPDWLRPLAYLLPPTWAVEALRDVMLRGWGLDRVWIHVTVLAGFAVVFIGSAVVGLKRARA